MSDSHSDDWGSNPHRSTSIFNISQEDNFNTIGKLHNLTDATIRQYEFCHNNFLKYVSDKAISKEVIQQYYINCKQKEINNLAMLRLLYPESAKGIRFPKKSFKPKILPSSKELQTFFDALPSKYQPTFLLLVERI